jgi:hypothetical protein
MRGEFEGCPLNYLLFEAEQRDSDAEPEDETK